MKVLSSEDQEIWHDFTKKVEKKVERRFAFTNKDLYFSKLPNTNHKSKSSHEWMTEKQHNLSSSSSIDKNLYSRLKSGKINPEKTLDLHGLKYNEALNIVRSTIISSYNSHLRLLLIVTGKGRKVDFNNNLNIEPQRGILRKSLPDWLDTNELRPLILNISSAHISHGGSGAFYVYLRKNKRYST